MSALRRLLTRGDPRLLVAVYAALVGAMFGVVLLPGEFSAGWDWRGAGLFAVLLWFMVRGSRVAWWIAVFITCYAVVGLAFIGADLDVESLGIVILLALQLMVLLSPSLRHHGRQRDRGAHVAH